MTDIAKPTFEDEYYLLINLLDRIMEEGKNVKQIRSWCSEILAELGEE